MAPNAGLVSFEDLFTVTNVNHDKFEKGEKNKNFPLKYHL